MAGVLMFTAILSQSCQKEDAFEDRVVKEQVAVEVAEDADENQTKILCEISDQRETVYQNLLGNNPFIEELNTYWACNNPLQEAGDCCDPWELDLNVFTPIPGGIEEWGPAGVFTNDPLADGILSIQEKQDLINKAVNIANANAPLCKDKYGNVVGQLVLQTITLGAGPTLSGGGIVISAYASYVPVCLF